MARKPHGSGWSTSWGSVVAVFDDDAFDAFDAFDAVDAHDDVVGAAAGAAADVDVDAEAVDDDLRCRVDDTRLVIHDGREGVLRGSRDASLGDSTARVGLVGGVVDEGEALERRRGVRPDRGRGSHVPRGYAILRKAFRDQLRACLGYGVNAPDESELELEGLCALCVLAGVVDEESRCVFMRTGGLGETWEGGTSILHAERQVV